eukprot:scaffold99817_cov62-Phaeocystis_antarctica.AAC.2
MVPFQKPTRSVMVWLTMMMIPGNTSGPVTPLSAFKLSKPIHMRGRCSESRKWRSSGTSRQKSVTATMPT